MKRFIFVLFALFYSICAMAQLEVRPDSFKEVIGFVNINTEKMYDDNDKPYAVLKIKTENIGSKQRRELNFGGDAQTFFEVEYKDGEVWLYISYYASFIKISHEEFSSTEFYFPFDMKPKCGYELTLVNKFNYNPEPDKPNFNYLIIKTDQADATISIDGQYAGEGQVAKSFKVGENHTWKIECDMYHTESGSITIAKDTVAMTVDKVLRPAFGYVNVISTPENGATVFIDNKKVGETPFRSDRLKSGEHTVRVMKEMFSTVEQTFVITDGNTKELKLNMAANFVNVRVTTDKDANIYIDNELVGKGVWNGRMTEGDHVFEARKESHRNSVYSCKFVLGKDENIVIPNPEPIYGVLDVNSTPIGATIIIDGKNRGTTPKVISDVLIGKRVVRIEKDGYNPETREITFTENNKCDWNVTLSMGKEIIIETNGNGYKIFIDGKEAGASPLKTVLAYGKHTISAYNGNKSASQEINVQKQGGSDKVILVLKKETWDSYFDKGYKFMTLDLSMNSYNELSYGLTMGSCKKLGWFASVSSNFNFQGYSADYECNGDFYVDDIYPEYTGTSAYTRISVIGGIMMNVAGPVFVKFGVGYGMRAKLYETNNGYWVKNSVTSAHGLDVDLGLQCNLRGLVISVEGVTTNFKVHEIKIGLGLGRKNK